MQQANVILRFLLPADENPPESVHPAMRPLDDPTARFETHTAFEFLGFFTPRSNVGDIPKLTGERADFVVVVTLVQAQPLRGVRLRPRPVDRNTLEGRPGELEIIAVRAVHGQADRYAGGFAQQAAFDAALGPVGRIRADFFPRPAGPVSAGKRPSEAGLTPRPASLNRREKRCPRRQPSLRWHEYIRSVHCGRFASKEMQP